MESKIKNWSRNLKWLFISAFIFYVIGTIVQLPERLAAEEWTIEYATQNIMEEVDKYTDAQASSIVLKTDIAKQYLVHKSYYLYGRTAEIMFSMAIFVIGFVITRRLSREVVFDKFICASTRWIGIIICISSIVVPSLAREKASFIIIGGFGIDIVADFGKLLCGILVIFISHILQQGRFLQEEYDTTL